MVVYQNFLLQHRPKRKILAGETIIVIMQKRKVMQQQLRSGKLLKQAIAENWGHIRQLSPAQGKRQEQKRRTER